MIDLFTRAAVVVAIGTLAACASSTNQQSAADQAAPVVANADAAAQTPVVYGNNDRMVCKRYAPTGTRISKKVCAKQSQWDALTKASQDMATETSRRAQHTSQSGN